MKHDAIVRAGIEIVERVPIPDELIPADARVEMDAKMAAGYFTEGAVPTARRARQGQGAGPRPSEASAEPSPAEAPRPRYLATPRADPRARARRCTRLGPARRAGPLRGRRDAAAVAGRVGRARHARAPTPTCEPSRITAACATSTSAASTASAALDARLGGAVAATSALRAQFELVITSVLLDAGAGRALVVPRGADRRDVRAVGGAGGRQLPTCS